MRRDFNLDCSRLSVVYVQAQTGNLDASLFNLCPVMQSRCTEVGRIYLVSFGDARNHMYPSRGDAGGFCTFSSLHSFMHQ